MLSVSHLPIFARVAVVQMRTKMILFLVGCKQSVSVASKTSEAESVGTAEVKTSARLSTEAEKKIIGLASGSRLLLGTSEPGGGACPRSAADCSSNTVDIRSMNSNISLCSRFIVTEITWITNALVYCLHVFF